MVDTSARKRTIVPSYQDIEMVTRPAISVILSTVLVLWVSCTTRPESARGASSRPDESQDSCASSLAPHTRDLISCQEVLRIALTAEIKTAGDFDQFMAYYEVKSDQHAGDFGPSGAPHCHFSLDDDRLVNDRLFQEILRHPSFFSKSVTILKRKDQFQCLLGHLSNPEIDKNAAKKALAALEKQEFENPNTRMWIVGALKSHAKHTASPVTESMP